MLLLIDTRDQRPPPDPQGPRRRGWVRAIPFVIALVCLVTAVLLPPLLAYLSTVATLALIGIGVTRFLPDMDGMHKHRQ